MKSISCPYDRCATQLDFRSHNEKMYIRTANC